MATQAQQFIGSYPGYSLLPATTSVQWLSQPSVFNHVYPYPAAVNYRGVVGNAVAPWFYYNNPYLTEVQTSSDVKDVAGTSGAARTKRQILLRYRPSSRRGRSLNNELIPVHPAYSQFDTDAALVRTPRQIQLRYRNSAASRRRHGRSINNE
jgi:hypothetical protein